MEKIKLFYENNRVFVILMLVSVAALIIILFSFIFYFIFQSKKDIYGNRLNGTEVVKIEKKKFKEVEDAFKDTDNIDNVTIRLQGKIIHVTLNLNKGKHDDAKKLAIKIMEEFSDKEKDIYDFSFLVDGESKGFPIIGYKKADNSVISWTNNSR